MIAKALTHFVFRHGPVEELHADPNSQLSDEDMKMLNKFMVNRLNYVFELIMQDRWYEFSYLISSHGHYGQDWDKPESDDGDNTLHSLLELQKNRKLFA